MELIVAFIRIWVIHNPLQEFIQTGNVLKFQFWWYFNTSIRSTNMEVK